MGKKLDMVLGGVELLVALGVSTLVGGAIVLVKPSKLGAVKKIAVGLAGTAISCMAADGVTDYVDKQVRSTVAQIQESFRKSLKKPESEETEEDEAAE